MDRPYNSPLLRMFHLGAAKLLLPPQDFSHSSFSGSSRISFVLKGSSSIIPFYEIIW